MATVAAAAAQNRPTELGLNVTVLNEACHVHSCAAGLPIRHPSPQVGGRVSCAYTCSVRLVVNDCKFPIKTVFFSHIKPDSSNNPQSYMIVSAPAEQADGLAVKFLLQHSAKDSRPAPSHTRPYLPLPRARTAYIATGQSSPHVLPTFSQN